MIVVLGLLAAAALSRFVDLSDDAHSAQVSGAGKSFREAVALVHAKWIARGASGGIDSVAAEGGTTIGVNDVGWPENSVSTGGDGAVTASECAGLWSSLLSAAPTVSTTAGAAVWLATVQGTTTCRYVYNLVAGREILYDTSTGAVSTTTGGSVASATSTSGGSAASTSSTSGGSASSGAASGSSGSGTTCGLVGLEPFAALLLVRLGRSRRAQARASAGRTRQSAASESRTRPRKTVNAIR
ncbi:MAG: hypothetical protein U0900_15920 [Myxococcota bacterium]